MAQVFVGVKSLKCIVTRNYYNAQDHAT